MANGPVDQTSLRRLLNPASVAVIGASPTPGALGASVIENLDRLGYSGDVHLVNPKRDVIGDRPCLKSAAELPPGVDVAILAIPRPAVLDTLRTLADAQVGSAIVFSSGFAEDGPRGAAEQAEIGRIASQSGMVVEGPNCLGLVNYVDRVALTFVQTPDLPLGDRPGVGIVSQSGAMAAVLSVMLTSRELGISYSVSTGNEAASGVEDYVEYMLEDPNTRVIGMIVEHFRQPKRFLQLADRARSVGKIIVLLHPGRSAAARSSAATHTGALAGDHSVMSTLVKHHGVVLAETLEELGDLIEILLRCKVPPAGGAVVIAESGAYKAMSLDLCEQVGLDLPSLTDENSPDLRQAMPPFVAVSNPIDLTAQGLADPDLYRRVLTTTAQDDRFGAIILNVIQTDHATCDLKFPAILGALEEIKQSKPVLVAGVDEGGEIPARYVDQLRRMGAPYFRAPERVLRAVARLSHWSAYRYDPRQTVPRPLGVELPAGSVPEYRAKELLATLGFPFPPGRLATSVEEALAAADELGYPIALKAQSAELSHKSDAGGVILGVDAPEQLRESWSRMRSSVEAYRPDLRLDGVLVERMALRGIELIIGARHEPQWGPVILVGFGGVQAELFKDFRLLPPDLSAAAAVDEILQLKCARLLQGFRGAPPSDLEAAGALVEQLGSLMLAEPSIVELDLNPVIVHPKGQGVTAADAVMMVAGAESAYTLSN